MKPEPLPTHPTTIVTPTMPHPILLLTLSALLLFFHPASPPLPSPLKHFSIATRIPPPQALTLAHNHNHKYTPKTALAPLTSSSLRQRPHHAPQTHPPPPLSITWPSPDTPAEASLLVPRAVLLSDLMQRIFVSPNLQALICSIPGANGDALTTHLRRHGDLFPLSAYALRDRERWLVRKDVFRFMFVRHPFSRLMGLYLRGTKGELNGPVYHQFIARVRGDHDYRPGVRELQKVNLQFFLTYLARQGRDRVHEDFRSQSWVCGYEKVAYAFVGRVEQFEKDIAVVEAKLGIGGYRVGEDDMGREAALEAESLFRVQRLRNKAIKLFDDDFKNFAYSTKKMRQAAV